MKSLLSVLFIFIGLHSFGQNQFLNPTLEITGNSEKLVVPDLAILHMTIKAITPKSGSSIKSLDKKINKVKRRLEKLDFSENDIKTQDFNIRKNSFYRNGKYIDSGYVATQQIFVEFAQDKERLGIVLSEFAEEDTGLEMRFTFKLSKELLQKTKNELIDLAVADARQKGTQLAKNFNMELGNLLKINFGNAPSIDLPPVTRQNVYKAEAMSSDSVDGFSPQKMRFTESVHIYWSLK